jgi:hypothetical protein
MNRSERRAAKRAGVNPEAATIAWLSNAMWSPTGYGTQTKQVVSRMAADGHKVAVIANYGLEAMQSDWEGIWHYPRGLDAYSNDVAVPYFKDWQRKNPSERSALFTLFDVWTFKGPAWDDVPRIGSWVPIDHLPVPPEVQAWCEKPNVVPIAMSQYGLEQLQRRDIEALYAPHALDLNLYKPTEKFANGDRLMTGRELMGLPSDAFCVMLPNANKGQTPVRKAWGENLLAVAAFAERHDDVVVYIHAESRGRMQGIDLVDLVSQVGLPAERVKFVSQFALQAGIPDEAMATLYTAADVVLAATLGEGFGLTVLEAAATGTPTIVNDFTAQPELVGEGWLTEGQPTWDAHQRAWFRTPNVNSIVDCLEAAYQRGQGRSQVQIDHAAKYDADLVFDQHWRPIIEAITR